MLNNLKVKLKGFFGGTDSLRIGIWGPRAAGKTTYLVMLYDELQVSGWHVAAYGDEARTFITDNLNKIQDGEFPAATAPGAPAKLYTYNVWPRDNKPGNNREITLGFVDAPGEFFQNIPDDPSQDKINDDQESTLLEYLSQCHGIIFLLDPEHNRHATQKTRYLRLLGDLTMRLKEYSREFGTSYPEQYMAFCVTKVDETDEYWANRESPEEVIKQVLGRRTLRRLEQGWCHPSRFKFFATSCVGRDEQNQPIVGRSTQGSIQPPSPSSQQPSFSGIAPKVRHTASPQLPKQIIKEPDDIQPVNVLEPLEWLISSMIKERPKLPNIR